MKVFVAAGVCLVLVGGSPPQAGAQHDEGQATTTSTPTPVTPALTPSFLGPGRAADLVYAGVEGSLNGARGGAGFESVVEAPLAGPISFRASAASSPIDRRVTPSFMLKVDLLRQGNHGIDGAVFGGYRGEGFNRVPAMELGVAVARRSQRFTLLSSVAYGQGLQASERYGDVRAAGLIRVHQRVDVGLDARARLDMELDDDEPMGEAGVDGVAGPLLVLGLGRFVLSGQAGVGAVALRAGGPMKVGPTARLGVGASF